MREEYLWFKTKEEVEEFDKLTTNNKLSYFNLKFGEEYIDFTLAQVNQRNKFIVVKLYTKEDLE